MTEVKHRLVALAAAGAVVVSLGAGAPGADAQERDRQCLHPGADVSGDYIPLAGDFDGDLRDEVLWYGAGAAPDSMWRQRAPGYCWKTVPVDVSGTYLPLVGDFGGDGHDDILWIGPGVAADKLWMGQSGGASTSPFRMVSGPTSDIGPDARPFVGDFNVDGSDDVFLYEPGEVEHVVWYSIPDHPNPPGPIAPSRASLPMWESVSLIVTGTYQPIPGDFDRDGGRRLIFWDAPGKEDDTHWAGNRESMGFTSHFLNLPRVEREYQALVGDYNRDAADDILWYGPGTARDAFWITVPNTHVSALPAWSPAWPQDAVSVDGVYRPIVGDFEGDGRDGIWWYAPGATDDPYWRIVPDHTD